MAKMATGNKGLYVVVWEWENKQRRWRPYPPEVTQQLERSFAKKLTNVFLGDSDPALKNYCINLSSMQQQCQVTGDTVQVRRNFFPQSSPAGQGAVWQWSGDNPGDWHTYDMCVQCIIESSWATGVQAIDMSETFPKCPYKLNFCNMTQVNSRTNFTRHIRRLQQAAYPVGKPPLNHLVRIDPGPSVHTDKNRRRGSQDDVANGDTKKSGKGLLDKVLHRAIPGSCSGGSSKSSPTHNHCENRAGGSTRHGKGTTSPPQPMPRSSVPPVPKPRTVMSPQPTQHVSQQPASHAFQQHPHYSNAELERHRQMATAGRSLRNEAGTSRFGSDRTLDSDCSSIGGRRPSADTISTYLSDDHNQTSRSHNCDDRMGAVGGPRVDRLIHLDSDDEPMEDDVFNADEIDEEVYAVMRNATSNTSPHRAPSPPLGTHNFYNQDHGSPKFFTPINPGSQSQQDSDQYLNGIKRKRNGEHQFPPLHLQANGGADGGHGHANMNGHACLHQQRQYQNPHQGSRGPIRPEDRLLVQYTRMVKSPPDEMCSICMSSLQESSGFDEDGDQAAGFTEGVASLSICNHLFHLACIREMAKGTPQFLECPNCKTMHGEKMGNQPNGKMKVMTLPQSLPGFNGCRTIQITYCINDGVQGPDHPRPGRPYRAIGFPRTAYLPDNAKGNKVLKLLHEAWRRRLIFTIGTSVTSGIQDAVTWNEIHHKTEWRNFSGHGYPDPNYLDNVLMELAAHGVSETTLV